MTTRILSILLLTAVLGFMPSSVEAQSTGFEHAITVSAADIAPVVLEFGQANGALDTYDAASDVLAPPAPPAGFDARLYHTGNEPIRDFYRDIRSIQEATTFSLSISPKSVAEPEVTLTWNDLPSFQGTLTLNIAGNTVDLTQSGSLPLMLSTGLPISGEITYAAATTGTSTASHTGPAQGTALESAFPNPTSATTSIRYRLGSAAVVSLSIYDMLGRRVAQLDDGWKPAGLYEAGWSGQNDRDARVSSGTYFIVLKTGENVSTYPLVVLQ